MGYRFNAPPNWPAPPSGDWLPPAGWKPDVSWGPAPDGWDFWVEDPGFADQRFAGSAAVASAAPGRGRRRLVVSVIAAVVALSLILVLVIWALWANRGPSTPASVRAQSPTATSVLIRWAPSTKGPSVDKYLVQRDGLQVGSVAGNVTSFQDKALTPSTTYRYRVLAVSGTKRSDLSTSLVVRTRVPPIPVGLESGPPTVSSVEINWSRPATDDPAPDRYTILRDGKEVDSVPGTVTSYRDSGLAPATEYRYAVTTQWGFHRSDPSASLVVKTLAPSASAARLQGSWFVRTKIVKSGGGSLTVGRTVTNSWEFKPKCTVGPCAVVVSGRFGGHPFAATLTRIGASYTGTTRAHITHCGNPGATTGKSVNNTLSFQITVKNAGVDDGEWSARSWVGNLVLTSPYTSAGGSRYCPANSVTGSLAASR